MKLTLKVLSLALLGAVSSFTFAEEPVAEHTVSGNISVLSSYNLRGITNVPENKGATLQGGLDYNHASGFYAGWWGSTLDYGSDNGSEFENNFYAGYNGSINEDLAYSNGFETMLGLSYKDFGISAQTLLEDTAWGNTGDTYIKGSYSYALPHDFSLDTALGLYIYKESGDYIPDSTESFGFRHFDIGLSKPLADTGVTASMNYILGGYDRNDVKQNNKVVFGLTYSF